MSAAVSKQSTFWGIYIQLSVVLRQKKKFCFDFGFLIKYKKAEITFRSWWSQNDKLVSYGESVTYMNVGTSLQKVSKEVLIKVLLLY